MKEKKGKIKETDQRKHKGQAMVLYLKPVIWFQINYILDPQALFSFRLLSWVQYHKTPRLWTALSCCVFFFPYIKTPSWCWSKNQHSVLSIASLQHPLFQLSCGTLGTDTENILGLLAIPYHDSLITAVMPGNFTHGEAGLFLEFLAQSERPLCFSNEDDWNREKAPNKYKA